ncbi:hypothetical protein D3C84_1032650 [compost metagenome]
MSNSSMNGFYYSHPAGYQLQIDWIDERNGKFTGKFGRSSSTSAADEKISGRFNFNSNGKCTDLNFSTTTDAWAFTAPYRGGEKYFETWSATRTSKSNAADKGGMEFNQDLSGQGGSWFGAV